MKRYAPLAYLLAAVLILWAWQRDAKRAGAAEQRARVADSLLTIAETRADSLRVVYRTDTLRLTKWRTRFDTALVTLNVTDTVEVLRFVAIADSTIRSCSVALQTCESRVAAQEAITAQWRVKFESERARRPSFVTTLTKYAAIAGAGWLAGRAGIP